MLTVSILTPVYGVENISNNVPAHCSGSRMHKSNTYLWTTARPTAVSPFWNLSSKNIQKGLRRYASSIMRKIGAWERQDKTHSWLHTATTSCL